MPKVILVKKKISLHYEKKKKRKMQRRLERNHGKTFH